MNRFEVIDFRAWEIDPVFYHHLQGFFVRYIKCRIAVVAMLAMVLLSGCMTSGVATQTKPSLLLEPADINAEVRFDYLLQFSGGRYVALPALNEYLNAVGRRLVRLAGYKALTDQFAVVNSHKINAWVTPEGRVAVSLGMLKNLNNEAELAALLGHLLSHAAQRHATSALARGNKVDPFMLTQGAEHPYAQYVVGAGLAVLAEHVIRYNSSIEQRADQAAISTMIKAGYDPQAAVDLQLKELNQASGKQPLWLRHHATDQERLAASRQYAHERPSGLLMAEESYQKALESFLKYEGAYQQWPQLQALLDNGEPEVAYELVRQLILIAPREGRFYALKGDALQQMGEFSSAAAAYRQAITRDPRYFAYHLRLAEQLILQQAIVEAQRALLIGVRLLPTAKGYLLLAQLAKRQGQLKQARDYYQQAALSDTPLGVQADREAKRVDFDENPSRYIHIKHERLSDNSVRLFVTNLNPYPVQLETLLLKTDKTYRIRLNKKIPAHNSINSTVTINGLGAVQSVTVDKAKLMH